MQVFIAMCTDVTVSMAMDVLFGS